MNPTAKKILLVEDDQSIRELYAMAFIKAGLNILMAQDGDQGVRLALEHHPDIVLLDIDMPIMNGFDAAAKLREDNWGATVPIIFLTNRADPRDKAHASVQMPERFITKAETPVREVVNEILKSLG